MITFCIALACLVLGYFLYGTFVEKVFGLDSDRKTPCYTRPDGTDYIPMPTWKVYTVQFLNIAGTGPIFGALMGILYGPAAFLWIVLGCLLGGAMHDYMSGMISIRRDGASLPEIIGDELGGTCRLVMRVVTLVLMICVGASFVMIPAGLMDQLTVQLVGIADTRLIWTVLIFLFYLAVTVFSIDKIVGNVYPIFGAALLLMAVLVGIGIFSHPEGSIPSFADSFTDWYPVEGATPLFPGLFITIACGAVSGFHATQSPMMARCIKNEKYGLRCFYGAMVTEGVVALIWAAASIKFVDALDVNSFYGITDTFSNAYEKLYYTMTHVVRDGQVAEVKMDPSLLVNMLCNDWLGRTGLVLAVLGIVAAPMSTGGSAFRAARLICADFSGFGQKTVLRRVLLAAPLFLIAILMLNVSSFKVLWLYVSWFNQVLATFTFFTITHYLHHRKDGKGILPRWSWCIAFLPAVFMLSVSSEFILVDKGNGFGLPVETSEIIAAVITTVFTVLFVWYDNKKIE
ncbi:MAG: carbon starvation protein A [Bacteroidaceae bacterium]|nr:carbon starvation protein A [Bacteroidaceae bacterium]